jgi:hypothetical protein
MSARDARSRLSREGWKGLVFLVAAAILMALVVAAPYAWRSAVASQIEEKQRFLTLLEAKARSKPQFQDALNPRTVDTAFITGATSGLATAELQRLLVDTAEKHGMVVERTRPLPAESGEGVVSLRMEVNTSGSIEALRGYLYALETGAPLIFVNQVHIMTAQGAPEGEASEHLNVRLEVEGFAWREKA